MGSVNHRVDFEKLKETTVKRKEGIQMKKSNFRKLSMFLAVVLIISMMPAAVFAADTETHEFSYECSGTAVGNGRIIEHTFYSAYDYRNDYSVADDYVCYNIIHYEILTCADCGYTTTRDISTSSVYHDWQKVAESGTIFYQCTVCGVHKLA